MTDVSGYISLGQFRLG